ncbi:DUF192 domain-containing protein [Coraliomargarita sp. SDUM461004]|uniref:DUF192 domain-containing protein n=1 Tax=Thalassobacterium sedimentorum TaxID=3041258 RepID=A0ABU1AML9_9BACT|nr:DUF192 domain-containing protein [Coraliomargarita sp. SDUM461004]MDQ8195952.1 DUF192 domain-containing protein [Coraliomargarita sp. SDUM461004]
MKQHFIILLTLWVLTLVACQPTQESPNATADSQTYFPITIDGHELQLQLALNAAEQQKGLMHRDTLAEDHGMLFLFDQPGQRAFWMRNTRIPLDIGYFDSNGTLLEVHKLFPYDETSVPSANATVLIAVETNRGWYQKHHVKPGARIDLTALQTALKLRKHPNSALQHP